MSKIQILDPVTIDKIAAGEVVERPASIVKELSENAIDAGAPAVTVEIEEGGISYIRIADNGCGIPKEEVPSAFLRHSTSKIRSVDDLLHIHSLGFRGEALSSIAAVSQVEMITKTQEETFGTRYRISGGKEEDLEETGAKDGTTFIIRQLFYNTPARRKFLKTPMTEASHVSDLMTRMALSHPEISFQFINNHQSRIHTAGRLRPTCWRSASRRKGYRSPVFSGSRSSPAGTGTLKTILSTADMLKITLYRRLSKTPTRILPCSISIPLWSL